MLGQSEYSQLGNISAIANGQLVPTYNVSGMFPSAAYVPYYVGRGAPTPTLPMPASYASGGDATSADAAAAAADPFNPILSPVVWAIIFLVVGYMGLRHIHFRGVAE